MAVATYAPPIDEDPADTTGFATNLADGERGDRAADEIDEQRVRSAKDALSRDERRQHHRRDDADAPVEQRAEDTAAERHGNQLGMHGLQLRDDRAADEHERRRSPSRSTANGSSRRLRAEDDDASVRAAR